MKVKKVLHRKILPTRLPVFPTLTTWLALDYWSAPEWVWGCCITLFALFWIGSISHFIRDEEINLFEDETLKDANAKRKGFQDRLDEMNKRKEGESL